MKKILVQGIKLTKIFRYGRMWGKHVEAVKNVNVKLLRGKTLSLIGESGSGKTTLGKILSGIIRPTKGKVIFNETEITSLKKIPKNIRRMISYIPQHPEEVFDPRWRLYDSIAEPLRVHKIIEDKREEKEEILKLAETVSLDENILNRKPFEVSGGELQRAVIASALATNPIFIVCDEPTSMLDPSVQAEILRLLKKIQNSLNLTYLFISHDFRVAMIMGYWIGVMLQGRIVEIATADKLEKEPLHPYTKSLMWMDETISTNSSAVENSNGCPFYDRCPLKTSSCKYEEPKLKNVGGDHYVACFRY